MKNEFYLVIRFFSCIFFHMLILEEMDDCIFCKIIDWEIPSTKIWEDEKHYVFFDIFPNCKWQALIIPKSHHNSNLFEMWEKQYSELMIASKYAAWILKEKFQVERVWMIMEWMWVNHAHIKLYPMHGLSSVWTAQENAEKKFFENYPGYLTSQLWEMLREEDLEKLTEIIHK